MGEFYSIRLYLKNIFFFAVMNTVTMEESKRKNMTAHDNWIYVHSL